ncbi:ATP-binding domain-containing protein [Streptomyces sp. NPDC002205]|uniref:ATP-binding domain-containing protein n=1 Tax=Streptomyces sp. NPDC002205 TaxID=3154411 RepID=UPI00331F403A
MNEGSGAIPAPRLSYQGGTVSSRDIRCLTCHQSKGREWNTVAIRLSGADTSALALGLDPAQAGHRALYVTLTRARLNTLALT